MMKHSNVTVKSNEQSPLRLSRRNMMLAMAGTAIAGAALALPMGARASGDAPKGIRRSPLTFMADTEKLSKYTGLPWDLILTSELVQSLKPDPKVYQLAPKYLGVLPSEILMVACHKLDLRAAAAQGFKTAFVARPLENGAKGAVDVAYESEFDFNAKDFNELADLLQA